MINTTTSLRIGSDYFSSLFLIWLLFALLICLYGSGVEPIGRATGSQLRSSDRITTRQYGRALHSQRIPQEERHPTAHEATRAPGEGHLHSQVRRAHTTAATAVGSIWNRYQYEYAWNFEKESDGIHSLHSHR